jgi:hypothetical protein
MEFEVKLTSSTWPLSRSATAGAFTAPSPSMTVESSLVYTRVTTHPMTTSIYRVGSIENFKKGNYLINWTSGHFGQHYDEGINPHIALNNKNEVVAVHQYKAGQDFLHYRRGIARFDSIQFADNQRYDKYARHPAVALLDTGKVVEIHVDPTSKVVSARLGQLTPL